MFFFVSPQSQWWSSLVGYDEYTIGDHDDAQYKSRRPVHGLDKPFKCTHSGCKKSYYERKNLFQHQQLKHGRPLSRIIRSKSLRCHSGQPAPTNPEHGALPGSTNQGRTDIGLSGSTNQTAPSHSNNESANQQREGTGLFISLNSLSGSVVHQTERARSRIFEHSADQESPSPNPGEKNDDAWECVAVKLLSMCVHYLHVHVVSLCVSRIIT